MSSIVGQEVLLNVHPEYAGFEFVVTGIDKRNDKIWLNIENYDDEDVIGFYVPLEAVSIL